MQRRVGKAGKVFRLIKFATMLKNSPNIGTGTLTVKNDPRVFASGSISSKDQNQRIAANLECTCG